MKYLLFVLLVTAIACGSNGAPTSPSATPTPTPAPTPTPSPTPSPAPPAMTVTLTGVVTAQGGARVSGATIRILDGVNVGRSTTTTNGDYRFEGLAPGNGNLSATATGYNESRAGIFINNNALNFTLQTTLPWAQSGTGNTVFDMPTYLSRVRVVGEFSGFSTNFVVRVGGRLVVNELLGTGWGRTRYEGTHLVTGGGVVEITLSTGVGWSLTEVR